VTRLPLYDGRVAQADRGLGQVGEERDAVAEQDGHQVHGDFVDQAQAECLLGDVRPGDGHRRVPGDGPGLLDGAAHAVGDEGERRVRVRPVRGRRVGRHEHSPSCTSP